MKSFITIYSQIGLVRLSLLILFIGTLLYPASLELHVLCSRLLFNLNSHRVLIQGQPETCVIYAIPNTRFSEAYLKELSAIVPTTPDVFILKALYTPWYPYLEPPSQNLSKDHPMLEWIAFRTLLNLNTENGQRCKTQAMQTVIQSAQAKDPSNGALWLPEACVHFYTGDDLQALNALDAAMKKGHWQMPVDSIYQYVNGLLQNQGISRFESSMEATYAAGIISVYSVGPQIMRGLVREMTLAIQSNDSKRFARCAQILQELQKQTFDGPHGFNPFSLSYLHDDNLLNAIANKFDKVLPPHKLENLSADEIDELWEKRQRMENQFLKDCFQIHMGKEFTQTTFDLNAKYRKKIEDRRQIPNHYSDYFMWSRFTGAMALLFLALFIIDSLFTISFRFTQTNLYGTKRVPRDRLFWIYSFICILLGGFLLANGYYAVEEPVHTGMHTFVPKNWGYDFAEVIPFCVLGVAGKSWFWIVGELKRAVVWSPIILGYLYLASILTSVWLRSETLNQLIQSSRW